MELSFAEKLNTKALEKAAQLKEDFITKTVVKCRIDAELRAGNGHLYDDCESEPIPNILLNQIDSLKQIIEHRLSELKFKRLVIHEQTIRERSENSYAYGSYLGKRLTIRTEW